MHEPIWKTLLFVVMLSLAPGWALARVGETEVQIKERYGVGAPSDKQRQPGAQTWKYQKEDFQIEVVIHEGRSVWEIFHRNAGDRRITDAEIAELLKGYAQPGMAWRFDKRAKRWVRPGKPRLVGFRWPGHEDFFCLQDEAAMKALDKKPQVPAGL